MTVPSRIRRWLRNLPLAGRALLGGAILVMLLGLFYAEENWRGERAWENCRRELVAKGVELEWLKFVPPPVPDEQNFAMTPFLSPLFDFNPKPLQPGQKPWRDSDGFERAQSFGKDLLPAENLGPLAPTKLESQLTDFDAELMRLKTQSNAPAVSAPAFPTRAAAAKAVLEALEPLQPVLNELQLASRRPYSRFNIQYDTDNPMSILLPHYRVLQRVGKVLQLHGSAELALDQSNLAFDDLRLTLFLSDSIRQEPFLITLRARANLLRMAEQLLWDGLAQRLWLEPQLRDLQRQFSQINLLGSLSRGLQAERAAFGNQLFRYVRSHKNALRGWVASDDSAGSLEYLLAGPEGWLYQEQAVFQRLYESHLSPVFDFRGGRLRPREIQQSRKALQQDLRGSALWRHNAMSKLILDNLLDLVQKCAYAQTCAEMAATACALERYRFDRGTFPDALEALVPQFGDALLPDTCDGHPLKYRRVAPDRFVLYGVGWDEADDVGTTASNPDSTALPSARGDWVWPPCPTQ